MMRSMVIDMNDEQLHTLTQMQAFLDGTVAVEFSVAIEARYGFIARTVRRFGYAPALMRSNLKRSWLKGASNSIA